MAIDFNLMAGGEAGQGIQSIGAVLSKVLARGGYHVFADQDYESRVRGGHNFYRIRAADAPVLALDTRLDILIALDALTLTRHRDELKPGGVIITDTATTGAPAAPEVVDVPLACLAEEEVQNPVMANSVATGAALGLVGYDFTLLADVLAGEFKKAGPEVAAQNARAARAGYDYVRDAAIKKKLPRLGKRLGQPPRMLINGNQALALGALAAGCKFSASYPMTPASSIHEYLVTHGEAYGVVCVQPEDEISAINMVVGAGYAGVRAMTATSGGGFCYMAEGLGLAGITETPVVVMLAQRPGPAIGLPTRTEQSDLDFALAAGNGEFPRAVLAPASVEECFWAAVKAFNLAEMYQTPVIVLTDQHLASSAVTLEKFDLNQVRINRGELLQGEALDEVKEYLRHRVTASGVSPRALPGASRHLVVTDSDAHDAAGHPIEDAATRTEQVNKRQRKLDGLGRKIAPPNFEAQPNAARTLIGWGSTRGALREAAQLLAADGLAVNTLHFSEVWPFPVQATLKALADGPPALVVENNASGQFARLLAAETGVRAGHIGKFDGRPFAPAEIAARVRVEVA